MRRPRSDGRGAEPSSADLSLGAAPHHGFAAWLDAWPIHVLYRMALGFANFGLHAVTAWMPTVLARQHHLQTAQAGYAFGIVVAVCGASGACATGRLADVASRRDGPAGRMRVTAFAVAAECIGTPLVAAPSPWATLAGAALAIAGLGEPSSRA